MTVNSGWYHWKSGSSLYNSMMLSKSFHLYKLSFPSLKWSIWRKWFLGSLPALKFQGSLNTKVAAQQKSAVRNNDGGQMSQPESTKTVNLQRIWNSKDHVLRRLRQANRGYGGDAVEWVRGIRHRNPSSSFWSLYFILPLLLQPTISWVWRWATDVLVKGKVSQSSNRRHSSTPK